MQIVRRGRSYKELDEDILKRQLADLHDKVAKCENEVKPPRGAEYPKESRIKAYLSRIEQVYCSSVRNIANSYGINLRQYHVDIMNDFIDAELLYFEKIVGSVQIQIDGGKIVPFCMVDNDYANLKYNLILTKLQNEKDYKACKRIRISNYILTWGALIISIISLMVSIFSHNGTQVNLDFPDDFTYQHIAN